MLGCEHNALVTLLLCEDILVSCRARTIESPFLFDLCASVFRGHACVVECTGQLFAVLLIFRGVCVFLGREECALPRRT